MRRTWEPVRGRPRPRAIVIAISAVFAAWTSTAASSPEGPIVAFDIWRRLPISFERNDGQFPAEVLYVGRGIAGQISLRRGELCIAPRGDGDCDPATGALKLRLKNSNLAPEVEARREMATLSHHYLGNRRYENVPHYGEIRLREVYPQVDLALHGTQGALEYDLMVAPGGDPDTIRLDLSAAESVKIDPSGNLVARIRGRTLVQHAPVAYQTIDDTRVPVRARYELEDSSSGSEARFVLGDYDTSRALVIDPLLSYSTYLGGSAADFGGYMQVDSTGKIYVAHTIAPDGTFIGTGNTGVMVTKLDPFTNTVVFATTLKGSTYDVVQGLAIGASGAGSASYITGYTASHDFPHCFVGSDCLPHAGGEDAFVSILNDVGTLIWSRLLGGSGDDQATGIAVDSARNIHVVGSTDSFDFPTVAAQFPNRLGLPPADPSDAFVAKFAGSTGALVLSTYLGGSAADYGTAIALDPSGNIYVGGNTQSGNFPKVNQIQSTTPAMFVTKLGSSGGPTLFSTTLGGSGDDLQAMAVDQGNSKIWVTGDTDRSNFTFVGASGSFHGGRDVFLTRLVGSSGSAVEFSTLIGGTGNDYGGGIALGASGTNEVYIAGIVNSPDFPTINSLMPNPGGSSAFVARLRGSTFDFSSYLGGSGGDFASSVVAAPTGEVYVSGWTASIDFPTVNPYRASRQGSSDIFVSKMLLEPGVPRNVSAASSDGQLTVNFTPPASNGGSSITTYTVTCNPGNIVVSGSASPLLVTGLTNGVQYTCSLIATNGVGTSTSAIMIGTPAAPVTLQSVVSPGSHGAAGNFDVPIDFTQPIGGSIAIDPRWWTSRVVFTFSGPVYSGFANVKDAQNTFYDASTVVSGNSLTVFFNVPNNGKRITVSLFSVNAQNINVSASLGLLAGDVNGSGAVTASDILIEKGKVGQPVLGATFTYDIDQSGDIASADVDSAKSRSGTELQ